MQDQKDRQKSPSGHHRTTLSGYIFTTKALIDNRKKNLLNSSISPTCLHNIVNFGPLAAEIGSFVWAPQQISTGFASWLRYCRDVAQRKPTKRRTMFDRHLGWYTIYTFSEAVAPYQNFARCKNSLCVQVLRCPISAALLHGIRVVGVRQTLRR